MQHRGLRYMPALDGLRAVAVLAVMLYHADVNWAKGGYFGVDAFFVLSGFLITSLLVSEWRQNGTIDLKAFWVRRARRLLPALALVLVAVAWYASHAANPLELDHLRRDGLSTMAYVANWNLIFSHTSYFQQFAAPSALKHTWSLAIEEQFYLLWPLIFFGVLKWRRGSGRALLGITAVGAGASAVLMGVLYQPGHDPSRVYYGTDTHVQSLLVGAMLAMFLSDRPERLGKESRAVLHGAAGIAAALSLIIWSHTSSNDGWQYRGGFLLVALLVAIVITSVTQPDDPGPIARVLANPVLRFIGVISYGLYLWHWPVYVYLNADRTGLHDFPLLFVRFAVTFAFASASFYLVERPIRRGAIRGIPIRVLTPVAAGVIAFALVASTAGAVPQQYRSISAADLAPPPTLAPTAKAAPAAHKQLRMMLVGDSVAASLAPGLQKAAAAQGILFWSFAVPGCGLASDVGQRWVGDWLDIDPHCLPAWRERWKSEVAMFQPDIVVGLFGAQDTFDRRINGNVIKFDSPAGATLAQNDLRDAVNVLTSTKAHLVLLSTPYYVVGWPIKLDVPRSLMNPDWINMYDAFERVVAKDSHGKASVVDLNKYLDPNGVWTDTVNGVKVRSFDKMHLSEDGAKLVGSWLLPQLLRAK